MFSTPVVGNEVTIELFPFEANHWNDPCFAGNDYEFCVQMEFYGKALGWCALKFIPCTRFIPFSQVGEGGLRFEICHPFLQTLILFQTKIVYYHYPLSGILSGLVC